MYFNYRMTGIASIASLKFRGETGVGGQRLLVDAAITRQPDGTPTPPKIFAIGGHLSLAGSHVAPLQLAYGFWPCFPGYSQTNNVSLRAFLTPQQVRAVVDPPEEKVSHEELAVGIAVLGPPHGPRFSVTALPSVDQVHESPQLVVHGT